MKTVTNLLGKRVEVRHHGYDDGDAWSSVVTGVVRGVAMITAASFAILLEVEGAPGDTTTRLYHLGISELPAHSLITVSTDQRYEGHVAIVVLDEAS